MTVEVETLFLSARQFIQSIESSDPIPIFSGIVLPESILYSLHLAVSYSKAALLDGEENEEDLIS